MMLKAYHQKRWPVNRTLAGQNLIVYANKLQPHPDEIGMGLPYYISIGLLALGGLLFAH